MPSESTAGSEQREWLVVGISLLLVMAMVVSVNRRFWDAWGPMTPMLALGSGVISFYAVGWGYYHIIEADPSGGDP